MLPHSRVVPSGSALATTLDPSAPAAPARFSTTTVAPSARGRCWPTRRAATSTGPPGGKGTMSLIGLEGYDCAAAGGAAAAPSASTTTANRASGLLLMTISDKRLNRP